MFNFQEARVRAQKFRDERGWVHPPGALAHSLMAELGELNEYFQFFPDEQIEESVRNEHRVAVADELADIMLVLLLISLEESELDVKIPAPIAGLHKLRDGVKTLNWLGGLMSMVNLNVGEQLLAELPDKAHLSNGMFAVVLAIFVAMDLDADDEFHRKMAQNELEYPVDSTGL